MKKINLEFVKKEIIRAEKELIEPDKRAIRLWERIKITPTEWSNNQYPGVDLSWVIATMGFRCLYFNNIENGWGWGSLKNGEKLMIIIGRI